MKGPIPFAYSLICTCVQIAPPRKEDNTRTPKDLVRGNRNKAALRISSVATRDNLPLANPSAAMLCTTPGTPANFTIELVVSASPGRKINMFPAIRRVPCCVPIPFIETLLSLLSFRSHPCFNEERELDLLHALSGHQSDLEQDL